ncbi:HlyD family type I secretion periplasmic adaptor subunit [Hyphococcus sp.]|uniref:HlyD family type I secretion periplasmic adaptor subunit n=1 Tax=Hyphococcus sp. TaxID=2038636 RepID=UPI002081A85F|nr:MAG: HlyD family type I secretion periplasmic adaptor subunit [Marinicaulis sp.]
MSEETSRPASARFFIRLGLGAIAAIFGGVAFWSIVAPIDGAVIANGQVVVESNRKAIQHLEGGVIADILVKEGDEVEAGAVLVELEDTVAGANLALIDGQLTELYARRARLEAERDGLEEIATPRGVEEVLATDAFEGKQAGQQQLFEARRKTRLTQIGLLHERIVQQKERMVGLDAQISSLRDQRALIEDELAGVRELNEQGFAPMTRVRALERESRRLSGERGALRAGVAEATSIIAEANLEIERLHETGREEAITELRDIEVSIPELEERRVTAAQTLRRTEVRAPQAGRIMGLNVHTVGGVIAPGEAVMEIVPRGDRLQIAARVAPRDVDKIHAGQETIVRFSAFGARMTPEATGVVRTVSADSFYDESLGAAYYLVVVDIPQDEELSDLLRGAVLVPGMPVEAFIRTGSRPAISYFLKPLTDALARSMREE